MCVHMSLPTDNLAQLVATMPFATKLGIAITEASPAEVRAKLAWDD